MVIPLSREQMIFTALLVLRQRNGEIRYKVRAIHDRMLLPARHHLYMIFNVEIEHISGDAPARVKSCLSFPDRLDQCLGESAMATLRVLKFTLIPLCGGKPDKARSLG